MIIKLVHLLTNEKQGTTGHREGIRVYISLPNKVRERPWGTQLNSIFPSCNSCHLSQVTRSYMPNTPRGKEKGREKEVNQQGRSNTEARRKEGMR